MAPQPQQKPASQVEELPASVIRAENEDAVIGAAEDVVNSRETRTLDQNPDIDPETGTTRREPIQRSPSDDARSAIAKRFRREEPEDERPFNGDMADEENLYGVVAQEGESDDEYDARVAAAERGEQPPRQSQETQPAKRKLKVRGQDVELTDDEILEAARKTLAGDSYLDEARQLLKEAKEIRRGRAAPERQPHDDHSTHNEDDLDLLDPPDTAQPHEPTFKDVVQKIQYGDPEEAARDLEIIVNKQSSKAAQDGALQRLYDQDFARSQKQLKAFTEANPDLAADEMAALAIERGMYKLYEEDIKALGIDATKIPKDPKELANWHRFYRIHGYEVRGTADLLNKSKDNFLKWKTGGQQQPGRQAPPSRKEPPRVRVNVDRDDRRMAIPVQPSRGVAPRRDAPPVPRGSDVVAQMRRARGQV